MERNGPVNTKVFLAFTVAVAVLAVLVAVRSPRPQTSNPEPQQPEPGASLTPTDSPPPIASEAVSPSRPILSSARERAPTHEPTEKPAPAANKLERLTQIRETFRALATGDATTALRAAKQVTEETERETALLTLVTEWTQGELGPPRRRASDIELYGIEAGLGMELAKNPELAVLWANELTEGAGRAAILQQTAIAMVGSEPAAAFALSEQLPAGDRRKFFDSVFAGWAGDDTAAAMQWAEQLPDPTERDGAIQAIRTVAPVGIGAALSIQDGYPVINQLVPGTPAELSRQLHVGDRIVALAQGDNSFVNAQGVPLADVVQMIRGAPNTMVQLQVLPADAPPNSAPRTISITRDQLKFKR